MYSKGGKIEVAHDVIASIAGNYTMMIPGIVGMVSVQKIKDGVAEMLGRDQYQKGVIVEEGEQGISIRLYVVVEYGMKIIDIATRLQRHLKEHMKQSGIDLHEIHVHVESVRVSD